MTRAISVLAMLSILGNTRLSAQVIGSDLLVGSLYTNPSLDRYSGTTGAYLGPFGTGSSLVGFRYFTFGPDGNLYATPYDMNFGPRPILKFDGHTGALISTFVSADGFSLTFGPDGNLYRLERGTNVDRTVMKYNGVTGALIGTFVAGGVNQLSAFSTQLRFGPNGNLFVADGQKIQQFDGQTGAFLGQFTPSPSGGLTNAFDFIFGPNNKLLVAGENNIGNDRILQFDATTGAFLGVFALNSALNVPWGMAIGPDSLLYVASSVNRRVLRFDSISGSFVDIFVGQTASVDRPNYIGFTPFPIPEPTSLALLMSTGLGWFGLRRRQRL